MDLIVLAAVNAWNSLNAAKVIVKKREHNLNKAVSKLNTSQKEAFEAYVDEKIKSNA